MRRQMGNPPPKGAQHAAHATAKALPDTVAHVICRELSQHANPHMPQSNRLAVLSIVVASALSACSGAPVATAGPAGGHAAPAMQLYPNETPDLRSKINYWADYYNVPRSLVHRLAIRESTHRPDARNGPYYGLLQILPATARGMGFSGEPRQLLDPDVNLKYAVKYLRGAWMLADGSPDTAVKWYSRGYYYEAKRRGMLVETGLRKG